MSTQNLRPSVAYLKIPDQGTPYLEGCVCEICQAVYLDQRNVCSKCASRDKMQSKILANTGKLYSYSIVSRSFPGVEVPYISVIVDLDGGGCIKGNLIKVEPHPDKLHFGMPLKIIYADALGRSDSDGNAYLAYFFTPA